MDTDLPDGYRWATERESERWGEIPGLIVVPRTADCNGVPYTQGEADLALPIVRWVGTPVQEDAG